MFEFLLCHTIYRIPKSPLVVSDSNCYDVFRSIMGVVRFELVVIHCDLCKTG